jgi:hypothetical protein
MESWWLNRVNSEGISQGDVIRDVPLGVSMKPPICLSKETGKKGKEIWAPLANISQTSDPKYFLFRGQIQPVVIVSHSCDLDKKQKKRVLVAPIRQMDSLPQDSHNDILAQRRRSSMPLPGIPVLGDYYADLRLISPVDRSYMDDDNRVASMTEQGLLRLQAQLAAFFLRLDLTAALSPQS